MPQVKHGLREGINASHLKFLLLRIIIRYRTGKKMRKKL